MSAPTNQAPYLITSRQIPQDPARLQPELVKAFYDIATAVNIREISSYEKFQTNTGQRWYGTDATNAGVKRQAFRRVYDVGNLPNATFKDISLGFDIDAGFQLTKLYGSATNGVDWISLPFVDGSGVSSGVGVFLVIAPSIVPPDTVPHSKMRIIDDIDWSAYSGNIVIEYILNN